MSAYMVEQRIPDHYLTWRWAIVRKSDNQIMYHSASRQLMKDILSSLPEVDRPAGKPLTQAEIDKPLRPIVLWHQFITRARKAA